MDLRLDFFNALNDYAKELTKDDALLVLSHNKKDGDCITLLTGDWEILSSLFSVNGYVNLTEGTQTQFDNIKYAIINTAFNICMTDEKYRVKFLQAISKSIVKIKRYTVYESMNEGAKKIIESNNKKELLIYVKSWKNQAGKAPKLFDNLNNQWIIF